MVTCANCANEAVFNYEGTKYCATHLPKFLRTRNGLSPAVRPITKAPDFTWVPPVFDAPGPDIVLGKPVAGDAVTPNNVVVDVVEEVAEEVVEKPAPRSKKSAPTPKDVAPKDE